MIERYKRPDKKNALSLVESAEKEMKFTLTIKITEDSATTIIRNIYESFRMIGDALLVSKGIESSDHLAPINALLKLKVETSRPIQLLQNLRRLRHNLNYYGYRPKILDVEDTVSFASSCFKPLKDKVLEEINKQL